MVAEPAFPEEEIKSFRTAPRMWAQVHFFKAVVTQWVQNLLLVICCLCPLLNAGQMGVPSSYMSRFRGDYDEKSFVILSGCLEQCLKSYLTAGSLLFLPLIHFMPFLFAQRFTTLVVVRCVSHRKGRACSDKPLTGFCPCPALWLSCLSCGLPHQ